MDIQEIEKQQKDLSDKWDQLTVQKDEVTKEMLRVQGAWQHLERLKQDVKPKKKNSLRAGVQE